MRTVNVLEAKTNLSRLIDAVESGAEREIIIARNGKPAVRIVPLEKRKPVVLGILQGKVELPPDWERDFQALDADVMRLFTEAAEAEQDLADEAFLLDPARIKTNP
jgi:prevent-host-death family protein